MAGWHANPRQRGVSVEHSFIYLAVKAKTLIAIIVKSVSKYHLGVQQAWTALLLYEWMPGRSP